jgi:hypothetical protein
MECRERVLTTLNLEEPDRVPTHVIAIDANNVDKVLGKPQMTDFDLIDQIKRDNPDNWLEELSNLVESVETSIFSRMVEAAIHIGFDAMQVGIIPLKFINEHEMSDIFGRVWEVMNNEGNFFPFYKYGTLNSFEKWEALKKNIEENLTEKYCKMAKKFYRRINKKHKDKIFIFGTNDLAGIFESTWQGMGIEFFTRQLHKNPDFIKEVFDVYADFNIALTNSYMDVGLEVWIESADLAYRSGPIMSPKRYNDLLLPAYKKLVDSIHERGHKIVLHTDGDITPLLDFTVNCGFDGLHALEPTAGVDLAFVKKKAGEKLCLLGNVDVSHVLTANGTKEDVENWVKNAIKTAGPGGGYICSATNMHPGVEPQNLKWMVETVKKFGNYPINL